MQVDPQPRSVVSDMQVSDRVCSTKGTLAQSQPATDSTWSTSDGINGVEQKVTKFFQTPVEIDEARTRSREVLTHRVQELRRVHGQEWIFATDGSFDPRSNGPIEQIAGSGHRISIAEANMKKRIVYDSEIAGSAAMGTRQATNHLSLVLCCRQ